MFYSTSTTAWGYRSGVNTEGKAARDQYHWINSITYELRRQLQNRWLAATLTLRNSLSLEAHKITNFEPERSLPSTCWFGRKTILIVFLLHIRTLIRSESGWLWAVFLKRYYRNVCFQVYSRGGDDFFQTILSIFIIALLFYCFSVKLNLIVIVAFFRQLLPFGTMILQSSSSSCKLSDAICTSQHCKE